MRRVLHVIPSVSAARGGPSTAIWSTLEALRRVGVHVDLVTTDDDGPGGRMAARPRGFAVGEGYRVRYFPRQSVFYTVSMPLAGWLLRHVRSYDVVHVHGLFSFASVAAAQIARLSGVPYIVCPHGTLERWCRANRRPLLKRSSLGLIEGPILKAAARVHFASQKECEQARDIGLPIRPSVIPLGVDTGVSQAVAESRAMSGDAAGATATILYLSRIDKVKGLDLLIEAFARVAARRADARLVIAGDGDAELKQALRRQVESLGLADRVQWLGFVAGAAKATALAGASVFVLPSWSENFGVAIVEAMAAGVPVIVSRGVGVAKVVDEVRAGLVIDRSVEALAQALEVLLGDAGLRAAMGEAGRTAARREFSLEAYGRRLGELYASV